MYMDYRNGLNNCLNYQLQSLAAAVVNRAAIQINRKAKELGVDAKGSFKSDEEVGFFFEQIKTIQTALNAFIIKNIK